MKAVAYCRVSTKKEEQLDSLESQQKFFAEYAAKNAYNLVRIYADEGKSGTKIKNRTQLLKLLADAGTGSFEVVLIKDISRLARNTVDFLTSIRKLRALNIRVVFVNYDLTSSDSSEFMLTMLSAIAQEESANTSKRVRFGKRQNAEHGKVPNLIFGYDKVPGDYFRLDINKEEAAAVKRIYEMYTEEYMGTNRIAAVLNQEGIKTKRGYSWSQNAVCRILSNEIYTGKIINGKQEVEDFLTGKRKNREQSKWMTVNNPKLKIISDEIFCKARQIRKSRMNSFQKDGTSHKHALSRLLRCRCCGANFRRMVRTYKNTYITWVCNGRNSNGVHFCGNTTTLDEGKLTDMLCDYFSSSLKSNPLIFENAMKEYDRKLKINNDYKGKEKEWTLQLNKRFREKQKYMDMFTNDIITMEELKDKTNTINSDIKKLRTELEAMNKMKNNSITAPDNHNIYQYIEILLKNSSLSNKILRSLIDRIEVDVNGEIDVFLGIYAELTGF